MNKISVTSLCKLGPVVARVLHDGEWHIRDRSEKIYDNRVEDGLEFSMPSLCGKIISERIEVGWSITKAEPVGDVPICIECLLIMGDRPEHVYKAAVIERALSS